MIRPVFDMPASPQGWEGSSASLLRIVDPVGDAIAWFAPELGGCCAGYAVRLANDSTSPSQSVWRNIIVGLMSDPATVVTEHNDATGPSRWRFVERDPASCTMEWMPDKGQQAERWEMTASLTNAHLSLLLRVQNAGAEPLQTSLRLRLVLSSPPQITVGGTWYRGESETVTDQQGSIPTPEETGSVMVTVDSEFGPGAAWTEPINGSTRCTVMCHRPDEPEPIIPPGESRQILVLIGTGPATDASPD